MKSQTWYDALEFAKEARDQEDSMFIVSIALNDARRQMKGDKEVVSWDKYNALMDNAEYKWGKGGEFETVSSLLNAAKVMSGKIVERERKEKIIKRRLVEELSWVDLLQEIKENNDSEAAYKAGVVTVAERDLNQAKEMVREKTGKTTFEETGRSIGCLVDEKNKKYGDSFSKSGGVLRILYPNGITPDQYDDVLTVTRVLDKLFRVATEKEAFGESPWKDIAGYAILKVAASENEKQK